jgi:hypothetical protein
MVWNIVTIEILCPDNISSHSLVYAMSLLTLLLASPYLFLLDCRSQNSHQDSIFFGAYAACRPSLYGVMLMWKLDMEGERIV